MQGFVILDCKNDTVFEDDAVSVAGLTGKVDYIVPESRDNSVFLVVAEGAALLWRYRLEAGMYACAPAENPWGFGRVEIKGGDGWCRALLVTVRGYRAPFTLGGPIEPKGRLRYIDGCTDTGLIQPPKLGDPCLNALFFPPGILQTRHFHPSHRIGLVYDGEGVCHTDGGAVTPLLPGHLFLIPAGTWHWFETTDCGMRIFAFHPDSEFGPTDETHQMLDATKRDPEFDWAALQRLRKESP